MTDDLHVDKIVADNVVIKEAHVEKMSEPEALPPVTVTMIGTGDGRTLPIVSGTVATTPSGQPNIIIAVMPPLLAIVVRFVNTFLTVLLGLVTGALVTNVIPANDFVDLVVKCAGLSVAGAGTGLIKDLVTIFGRLEGKYPLLTGSV